MKENKSDYKIEYDKKEYFKQMKDKYKDCNNIHLEIFIPVDCNEAFCILEKHNSSIIEDAKMINILKGIIKKLEGNPISKKLGDFCSSKSIEF